MKIYFAKIDGLGTAENPFRTTVSRHITRPNSWVDIDCRADFTSANGRIMSIVFDPTSQEHADILNDPDIIYLPLENSTGAILGMTDTVNQISTENRAIIISYLESQHVPFGDIQGTDMIKSALRRVVKRYLLRQILNGYDFDEGFDTLVVDIPTAKRQSIAAILQGRGFDVSGITGTMTIRQAITSLLGQSVICLNTGVFE